MTGLFTDFVLRTASSNGRHVPLLPSCGQCGLKKGCISPVMAPSGAGARKILLVGEASAKNEDLQGRQFVGESGQLLRDVLASFGVDMRRDCWVLNSVACAPRSPSGAYRNPEDKEIDYCRPLVKNFIEEKQPELILLLGAGAAKSVLGWLWHKDVGGIGRWAGMRIPSQQLNAWVCPLWHPAHLLHERRESRERYGVLDLLWKRHLKAALRLKGRPWVAAPDHDAKLVLEPDPKQAAERICYMTELARGPVAYDFETTTLKPDGPCARIVSCALSDGKLSVAYPWHGEAIKATKAFLKSDVPKVDANGKFECRWALRLLKVFPKNRVWDVVLAAHNLDNRRNIASVKFQAFATLGCPPWDEEVGPFLKADGGPNAPNRIGEVPLRDLLRYNSMDSLQEWCLAEAQSKQLGVELCPKGE
jgi:uracil-DNA glycosylase family 4